MLNQSFVNDVVKNLSGFPESKISSLMDYIAFLKKESVKKRKNRKRKPLMSFAGILDESEADGLLQAIQESRTNKNSEITL